MCPSRSQEALCRKAINPQPGRQFRSGQAPFRQDCEDTHFNSSKEKLRIPVGGGQVLQILGESGPGIMDKRTGLHTCYTSDLFLTPPHSSKVIIFPITAAAPSTMLIANFFLHSGLTEIILQPHLQAAIPLPQHPETELLRYEPQEIPKKPAATQAAQFSPQAAHR